mmetsp:Transcript_97313/g.173340  ORF Transcript_97313/g.173340 Transcript_97313/m.173340 type:complete len:349 (-) Transcript_97313:381-1427(-)|eukprot:CAMPEP_0197659792 /NCGR_PEP_ID=MMETSP1338-20131121/49094_1 /TAXON_ID=43686 ORGANISM="Pelagodinium beii, Strain RCC1491" /NCGR_SAMPLE_ID=MMETSP1338 /ASSEMBLY_ACC=CAM_ASM_000754 /LENGTH=348 /DNA_ID=CAMNT_0043236889 /DNA_START=58 /DNA_END=1104 /DNA_ORIENTATION=+
MANVVCITGATGYLASHIVQRLLANGHQVRGTVRNLSNKEKLAPLLSLRGAAERLELVKADMMDPKGFRDMLEGCSALIHTATPVEISMDGKPPANEEEAQRMQISPAVDGTVALLKAAEAAGVKKVVLTSSISAMRASNPPPRVLDETCWSDEKYLQETLFTKGSACYNLAKTLQEREAWRLAETSRFRLITINPAVLIGPSLTPHLNFGQKVLLNLVQGRGSGHDLCQSNTVPDVYKGWVDVREVADAHVLALESDTAEGRYLLQSSIVHYADVVEAMRSHPRMSNFPKLPIDSADGCKHGATHEMNISKMRALGVQEIPFQQCIADTVESLAAGCFISAPQQGGA